MNPSIAASQNFDSFFPNRPILTDLEKARSYPVMTLTELFPQMKLEWVDGVGKGDRQFKVETNLDDRRFFGEVS